MTDPFSGPEIAHALRTLHAESVDYWRAFPTARFLAPIGDAWSPSENVRHLTKSVRAVTRALRLPRLVLLLRFGRAGGASRTYSEIRDIYRARLALGADAGAFGPGRRPPGADPEAERTTVMAFHATAIDELVATLDRWSERALDRRRLPHPLLGLLTVRETLLFTLYHNRHHVDVVRRRLGEA